MLVDDDVQRAAAVELVREVSWANLRDRLALGDLDAAQLLSPLPMMTTLGAGGLRAHLLMGLVLSLNGNALCVSSRLWQEIGVLQADGLPDARAGSVRLRSWMDRTQLTPTFATVHQFSMHTLQLRLWLRAGGIDPDREVRIIVLPPEQMADNLGRGVIDGYGVGEPWSTMAVLQGTGAITATGYQLWNNAPEKVLAVTARWHQHYREAARCLGLPCPAQEVRAENQHAQPWELESGIELGPDLQLLPD